MRGLVDAFLGTHDDDLVGVLLGLGHGDLGGGAELQVLQTLAFRAEDEAMVLFRDLQHQISLQRVT